MFSVQIKNPTLKQNIINQKYAHHCHTLNNIFFLFRIQTHSLYSLTALALSLVTLFVSATVPPILNSMDPQTIEQYPNYLWVFVLHHYSPQCVLATIGLSFYFKSSHLRNQVIREIREHWTFVRQNCGRFKCRTTVPNEIIINNNIVRALKVEEEEMISPFQALALRRNCI